MSTTVSSTNGRPQTEKAITAITLMIAATMIPAPSDVWLRTST